MAAQNPAALPHLGLVLGTGDRVLVADSGTYAATGQTTNLYYSNAPNTAAYLPHLGLLGGLGGAGVYRLTADQGTYSVTGQANAWAQTYIVAAAFGTYTTTGQVAGLTRQASSVEAPAFLPHLSFLLRASTASYSLTADTGIYTVSGSDGLADYEMSATQGSYSLTGQDAAALKTSILVADSGSYAATGQDATFSISSPARTMPAGDGAYSYTGNDASLRVDYRVTADQGFYALSGVAANLVYGQPVIFTLLADTGAYDLTGQDAAFSWPNHILSAESGSYVVAGETTRLLTDSDQQALHPTGKGRGKKRERAKYRVDDEAEIMFDMATALVPLFDAGAFHG